MVSAENAEDSVNSISQRLRHQAHPLDSVIAGTGFTDLEFLDEKIAGARIVSLGECTHGSREIFQMKHRLVEYLISKLGFSLFAIEGNLPETRLINDYIQGGNADPVSLIRGMDFWDGTRKKSWR